MSLSTHLPAPDVAQFCLSTNAYCNPSAVHRAMLGNSMAGFCLSQSPLNHPCPRSVFEYISPHGSLLRRALEGASEARPVKKPVTAQTIQLLHSLR